MGFRRVYVVAHENIKWIVIFVLIIFLSLFGWVIISVLLEDSAYNYFHMIIKNKTDSDVQISIENNNNVVIKNISKYETGRDEFFLNKRKWMINGKWTFKFTMTSDNSIFFQEIITPFTDKIGAFSIRGGLLTYIVIEDGENGYKVTFKDIIPEDY